MNSINHTINNSLLSSLEESSSASNLIPFFLQKLSEAMESGANVYSCCIFIFIFIISLLEEASDIVLFTVSASVLLLCSLSSLDSRQARCNIDLLWYYTRVMPGNISTLLYISGTQCIEILDILLHCFFTFC